jgi:hypothetical protein
MPPPPPPRATMAALCCDHAPEPHQLHKVIRFRTDVPSPSAAPPQGYVRVRVLAAGVAIDEVHAAEGTFFGRFGYNPATPFSHQNPLVPGFECCGVIVGINQLDASSSQVCTYKQSALVGVIQQRESFTCQTCRTQHIRQRAACGPHSACMRMYLSEQGLRRLRTTASSKPPTRDMECLHRPPQTRACVPQFRAMNPALPVANLLRRITSCARHAFNLFAISNAPALRGVLLLRGWPRLSLPPADTRHPHQPTLAPTHTSTYLPTHCHVTQDFKVGDVVLGALNPLSMKQGTGAWAEFALLPLARLELKPSHLSPQEALASFLSGLVAVAAVQKIKPFLDAAVLRCKYDMYVCIPPFHGRVSLASFGCSRVE